jgi:hypothetical protein
VAAIRYLCISIVLFLMTGTASAGPEIKTIETRPNVTLKFLINKPEKESRQVLVMFPGARGANHFREKDGRIHLGNNFLVRTTPDFVEKDLSVVIVDTPSDQRLGMEKSFRTSASHREDIDRLLLFLVGQGYESIYIVGTSAGTLSAAYLATALENNHIKGIVLTSTMSYSAYLRWLPLEKVTYPILIIHHRSDGCAATRYSDAVLLKQKFPRSSRVDFVSMEGGSAPRSEPCEALSAHGFLGIEKDVVRVIGDWVNRPDQGNPIP